MSLLDDARRLEKPHYSDCHYCGTINPGAHAEGCPMLSLPKIVAVLEAAERVMQGSERNRASGWCWGCGNSRARAYVDGLQEHKKDCPWQALVAALKDGEDR